MLDFKYFITSLIESNNRIKDENNIVRLEKTIRNELKKKYNCLNPNNICSFNIFMIENLIFNKRTHLVELFKDYLLLDYIDEFLTKFYKINESSEKIYYLYLYYRQYLFFFCKPTFTNFIFNYIIFRNEEKKANLYYNHVNKIKEYNNNDKNDCINIKQSKLNINNGNNITNNKNEEIIFNDAMRKKIENKNNSINTSLKLSEISMIYSNENSLLDIIDGINLKKNYKTKYKTKGKMYSNSIKNYKKCDNANNTIEKSKNVITSQYTFKNNINNNRKANKSLNDKNKELFLIKFINKNDKQKLLLFPHNDKNETNIKTIKNGSNNFHNSTNKKANKIINITDKKYLYDIKTKLQDKYNEKKSRNYINATDKKTNIKINYKAKIINKLNKEDYSNYGHSLRIKKINNNQIKYDIKEEVINNKNFTIENKNLEINEEKKLLQKANLILTIILII